MSCPVEEVLLEVADGVSRPAASMSSARARLAMLARRLPAPGAPEADLTAVAALLVRHLPSGAGAYPVLLPDALRAGRAHPLAAAAAGVAIARRAGMAIGVVGAGERVWLAHEDEDCELVVAPGARGGPFDGRALAVDLHWRCAHELAALTLHAVAVRARRTGDTDLALRVVRARMALPVEHGELRELRSRLN